MSKIKKTLILLILFSNLSCTKDTDQIAIEESSIISIMVDEMTVNLALAYELGDKENENRDLDTLENLKTTIFVDPIMKKLDHKLVLPNQFQELQDLVDNINRLPEKKINQNSIISNDKIKIFFDANLKNFKGKYPQILFFSPIAFNKELKTAILFAGNKLGKLQSYTNFYILKKNHNKWEIVYTQSEEIS